MTYADFFAEIKGRFMEADVSDITEHLAYQFNITGEASGIFYVEVKDGKLFVADVEMAWMCLKCGYVHQGTEAPKACPVCQHDQGYFIRLDLLPGGMA